MSFYDKENHYSYQTIFDQPDVSAKRVLSRLFTAICIYTVVSYASVFLSEMVTVLIMGKDGAVKILESPYYIFAIQVLSMYVIALPIFILICRTGATRKSEKRAAEIKREKQQGSITTDEMIILFFISVGALVFGNLVSNSFTNFLSGFLGHEVQNSTAELIGNAPIWLVIAVAVIIGPIVEELIFRKIFIDILGAYGRGYAIVVSAVTFGLFHGNFNQIFYATVLGLILGYIYVKSGKLIYSVIMHVAINFFGTVPTLLFGDSLERVLEGVVNPEAITPSIQYWNDLMNVYGLLLLQYGFAFAGLGLFLYFIIKRRYSIPFAKEVFLPRCDLIKVTLANPGAIIFAVLTLAQLALSIL